MLEKLRSHLYKILLLYNKNYQRKPARVERGDLGLPGSPSTKRHRLDLDCCRRLPPGARTASNRSSCLRRQVEPRNSNTPFQPDDVV